MIKDMEKVYGSPVRQDGLYKVGRNSWELIYGFGKDEEMSDTGWNWRQRFNHKPTIEEIKATVIGQIEACYADKLRSGFDWRGIRVEYTEERKSDFTGLLIGLQGGLFQLPITLNLGSSPDGTPTLHEFTSVEEVSEVASGISAHKIAVSNAEWQEKYSVEWSVFETEQ